MTGKATDNGAPRASAREPRRAPTTARAVAPGTPGLSAAATVRRALQAPGSLTAGNVLRLQRTVGNRATGALLQRHPEGTELPDEERLVAELDPAQAPPSATRTADQEKKDKAEAATAGTTEKALQKVSPRATGLATTQKILSGLYGGFKTIVPGTIVILADQPACAAKYDEVCMADGIKRPDGSAWKAGDCAKDDAAAGVKTQGFAWKGTIYVNGATTLITATAHEMLHVNAGANYRAKMGETFNEGTTEYLARKAIQAAGLTVPGTTAYPKEVELTTKLVALVGEETVMKAYFGDAMDLIRMYLRKGKDTWDNLRKHAEALDMDKAKKALEPK